MLLIAGIDEAGRGPLAGPVVAAAVIIPSDKNIPEELTDSKKLTEQQREELFKFIVQEYYCGLGMASVEEIDRLNILQATFVAMKRAVADLKVKPGLCLIDGTNLIPGLKIEQKTIIKGDQKEKAISAASIIAKVTRDRIMKEYQNIFPLYDFAEHKGYGTEAHVAALKKWGRTPIHRKSFQYPGENEQQGLFQF